MTSGLSRLLALAALGTLLASGPAFAVAENCTRPVPPLVPDGATASEDDLKVAKEAVLQFIKDSEAYGKCLEAEERRLGDKITKEQQKQLVELYNANVDEQQTVGAQFNTSLKAFKERTGG